MALEELSITFDDAKKVFGVCMGIGTFMAAGYVWMAKLEAHRSTYEPIVKDLGKVVVDEAKKTAVLETEVKNLKAKPEATNTGLTW